MAGAGTVIQPDVGCIGAPVLDPTIKVTRRGPNRYVQLVEAYRDPAGKPKQRTLATLGRLDQLNTELNSVISGLQRVTGQTPTAPAAPLIPPSLSFDAARDFGDVYTLTELWNALGFDGLRKVFRHTRHSIDVEALIRVMVFPRWPLKVPHLWPVKLLHPGRRKLMC